MSRPPSRTALRVAALAAPLVALALVPTAALADDGPGTDHPLGVVNSLLIFLVAPVGVFLVVAVLTLRPGSAPKAQRYRPGRDWTAGPAWTGVQPAGVEGGDDHAGASAAPVMDGAPEQSHADSVAEHAADRTGEAVPDTGPTIEPARPSDASPSASGGSSGSW